MAVAQAMPMPTFVARCLEGIGLEGRCGLSIRDMFALVDDAHDVVYRRYAWKMLRAMGDQITFHYMLHTKDTAATKREASASPRAASEANGKMTGEKRRRKWSTTLMDLDEGNSRYDTAARSRTTAAQAESTSRKRRRRRLDPSGGDAVGKEGLESTEDKDEETEGDREAERSGRLQSSDGQRDRSQRLRGDADRSRSRSQRQLPRSRSPSHSPSPSRSLPPVPSTKMQKASDGSSGGDTHEEPGWMMRSPRGYTLGEELDVAGLSYEDAMMETPEGVLGVVACEELRLKYLGVTDMSAMDTTSPQFDLLELIGRTREQGLNAAHVAEARVFGDSRKLHYLLDMLIVSGLAVKNIISADHKRFNIMHLTRFASRFHPTMISPSATFEKDSFPKEQLPYLIARILRSRGERTCVFADIGREFGYNKRHQEKLRKFFFQQMHVDSNFPIELFMARCSTGTESRGRKLWCVRLRSAGRGSRTDDKFGADGVGLVVERGIMEQMFSTIQEREDEGTTIPELRDSLGVPTFKLPYKLAQGLISNYSMGVEQVVLGKSTMYRMFAPGVVKRERELPALEEDLERAVELEEEESAKEELAGKATSSISDLMVQPSTMKEATKGLAMTKTFERRKQFVEDRVKADKIVSVHQLRTGLMETERTNGKLATDAAQIDIRSVRRIIEELEAAKVLITVDITLPPKRVLQKSQKAVKCAAVPGAQNDKELLRVFIDTYFEDQHRKHLEGMDHENDGFIVVSNRSSKKKRRVEDAQLADGSSLRDKEVVKYSATSYKIARATLVKLHKQSRRLGMFFGFLYRVRALHLLMWDRAPRLRERQRRATCGKASNESDATDVPAAGEGEKLVFGLKEVLDLLSVKEYLQIVGTSELLSETEENKVRMAMARGDSWEVLPTETQAKIRSCEADRFSRLLRVLLELRLLSIFEDSSFDLISQLRGSNEDFDQMISQVAFTTLSGGLFELIEAAHIAIRRGGKVLRQLPSKDHFVHANRFTTKEGIEDLTGPIPIEFHIRDAESAGEYWKSLKFLSIEGGRLSNGQHDDPMAPSVNLDAEIVRPVPLRDHNLYALKLWIPRAASGYRATKERAKAVADVVGDSEQSLPLKRKRYQASASPQSGRVAGRPTKSARKALDHVFSAAYRDTKTKERADGSGESRWRRQDRWGGAKSRIRAEKWTAEDDSALMDLYIEMLSFQWFIDIPVALQKRDERVAFRSSRLSRTSMPWKRIAATMGRKKEDCILRVRELVTLPAVQARIENVKNAVTLAKNPGGNFDEEVAVLKHPRLTALLCLAKQIIFHERSCYYSVLADMLISRHWKEGEVKLVWRYLWLASVITRTSTKGVNGAKNVRQRGFSIHSHVFETASLHLPVYSIDFFCGAAEYASFLRQNIKEAELLDDEEATGGSQFEQEVVMNSPGAQVAIDLTAMVTNQVEYVPEYLPPQNLPLESGGSATSSPQKTPDVKGYSPSLQESKRSLAIKGFAGHLSKQYSGAAPDDFLKEFWFVKAKYGSSDTSTPAVDIDLEASQAFSAGVRDDFDHLGDKTADSSTLSHWLLAALEVAGTNGLTIQDLRRRAKTEFPRETEATLERAIRISIRNRRCVEVNGAESVRLVASKHATSWMVTPYRIASDSTKDKVHFVFEQNRAIVSRPWLHLDGSVNTGVAIQLKRRVVNIVMCCPGIPDRAIHAKMNRALTLQDTRCLLEELVEEDIVYTRLTRVSKHARTPKSAFDLARQKPSSVSFFAMPTGQLRNVDNARDQLHYFPSVNCVELLGMAACDVDLDQNE